MTASNQTLYTRLFRPGRQRIFIFLAIITLPAGCVCIFIGYPIIMAIRSEIGCSKSYIYEQNVNITPLVNLNIPADMDMAQWEDPASNVISSAPYVRVIIERNPDAEITGMDFDRECDMRLREIGGSGNNQYCISKVIQDQAGPMGNCAPLGYYRSYVIIQKENVLIEIYEDSQDKASHLDGRAKDAVIQKITGEITRLASTDNYPIFYPGKYLYAMYCYDCHSTDGSASTGPSWKGVYGRQIAAEDGSSIIVDDAYISYAILHHQDNPRMNNVAKWITESQIQDLITYMKTLTAP